MKQLFFYELKQNVTRDFFKKYFHGEKYKIMLPMKMFFFHTCALIFKTNNSFAIKNDKISHFENFNHGSHLNQKVISPKFRTNGTLTVGKYCCFSAIKYFTGSFKDPI